MRRFAAVIALLSCLFATRTAEATPAYVIESGVRVSSGEVQAVVLSTTSAYYRLYFLRDFQIRSATGTDTSSFSEETSTVCVSSATLPSVGVASVTAATVLPLGTTGYRMLYSAITSSGTYSIFSATSTDGINWQNEAGARISPSSSTSFMGSPTMLVVSGANWIVYFAQDGDGGDDPADRRIYYSLSSDEGVTWSTAQVVSSSLRVGSLSATRLTNNLVRLYYTAPTTGGSTNTVVASLLSNASAGTSFSAESGNRISTSASLGMLTSLSVIRSTSSHQWRMFFGYRNFFFTVPHTYSAFTSAPAPTSISPTSVLNTDPAGTFSISGDIFSSSPTVKLVKTGQSDIVGTSVNRTDDQTITAVFDTQNKLEGRWQLKVLNADGTEGVLNSAVTITFPSGTLSILDNLFRPLKGGAATITVETFADGNIHLRVYTLDGRLVRTILNEFRSSGTNTATWDGRTDSGEYVASGTYLLKATGAKLEQYKKIVVIK